MRIILPPRCSAYRYPRMTSQTFQAQFSLIHDNCHSYDNLKKVRLFCYDALSDANKWQSEFLKDNYILDTLLVNSEVFIPSTHDRNFLSTPLSFTLDLHSYKDSTCTNKIYKLRHYTTYVEQVLLPRINNYIHRYGCRMEMTFADMSQSYDMPPVSRDDSPDINNYIMGDDENEYDSNDI